MIIDKLYLKKFGKFENKENKLIVFSKKALRTLLADFDVSFNCYADDVSLQKYLADFSGREESAEDVFTEYSFP